MKFDDLCKIVLTESALDDEREFANAEDELDYGELSDADTELMGLLMMSHEDELSEAKEHEQFNDIVKMVRDERIDPAVAREILLGVRDHFGSSFEDDDDDDDEVETSKGFQMADDDTRWERRAERRPALSDEDKRTIARGLRDYRSERSFMQGDFD